MAERQPISQDEARELEELAVSNSPPINTLRVRRDSDKWADEGCLPEDPLDGLGKKLARMTSVERRGFIGRVWAAKEAHKISGDVYSQILDLLHDHRD